MADTFENGQSLGSIRAILNGNAAEIDDLQNQSTKTLDDVAALLADTSLTYTTALPGTVVAGDYVRTRSEGFAYQVAASVAVDQHVTTAGGVKVYVVAEAEGMPLDAFGIIGDGSNEATAINAALVKIAAAGKTAVLTNGKTYGGISGTTIVLAGSTEGNGATIASRVQCLTPNSTIKNLNIVSPDASYALRVGQSSVRTASISLENISASFSGGTPSYRLGLQADNIDELKVSNCRIFYGSNLNRCTNFLLADNIFDGDNFQNNAELCQLTRRSHGIIIGNTFINSGSNWIDMYSSGEKTVITGNRFMGMKPSIAEVAGIEIKVTLADDPNNTSGGPNDLGYDEQIVISNNYFSGLEAVNSNFMQYIAMYRLDSRAVPVFTWADAPRNILVSGNIFEGFVNTLHTTGYFAALCAVNITGFSFINNIFKSMSIHPTGAPTSALLWIEGCLDGLVAGNRGALGYGSAMSLHGVNDSITITNNQFLTDYHTGVKSRYGINQVQEGSRPDPLLTRSKIVGNAIDATEEGLRFAHYSTGVAQDCTIEANNIRQASRIYGFTKGRIVNNHFAIAAGHWASASAALSVGSAVAGLTINAHNEICGNTFTVGSGLSKNGLELSRTRTSGVRGNHIHNAVDGMRVIGTNTSGEGDSMTIQDNYATMTGVSGFPRYIAVAASDTASLVAANNRIVTA